MLYSTVVNCYFEEVRNVDMPIYCFYNTFIHYNLRCRTVMYQRAGFYSQFVTICLTPFDVLHLTVAGVQGK